MELYYDGTPVAVCVTPVDTPWQTFFFVGSISVFFIVPFGVLLILYTVIANHLMNNPGITSHGNRSNVLKYRKQVIFMLGAVVLSFFLCLLPFRAFTLWIIVVPSETIVNLGLEGYYSLLYFCRVMLYLNSAMNPILYNLMSSKFREGFLRLLGCKAVVRGKLLVGARKGTFHTTSTNLSSSQSGDKRRSGRIREDSDVLAASFIIRACSEDVLMFGSDCERSENSTMSDGSDAAAIRRSNGFAKRKRSTFDDIEEIEEESPNADCQRVTAQKASKKKTDKEVIFYEPNGNNSMNKESEPAENEIDVVNPIPTPPMANSHTRRRAIAIGHKTISIDSSDSVIKYDDESVDKSVNGIRVQYTDDNEAKTFLHNKIGTQSFV